MPFLQTKYYICAMPVSYKQQVSLMDRKYSGGIVEDVSNYSSLTATDDDAELWGGQGWLTDNCSLGETLQV